MTVQSSTIRPFSPIAGCIPVGSPTTPKEMGGSSFKASATPLVPETSSSAEARKIRLYGSGRDDKAMNTCNSDTSDAPASLLPRP